MLHAYINAWELRPSSFQISNKKMAKVILIEVESRHALLPFCVFNSQLIIAPYLLKKILLRNVQISISDILAIKKMRFTSK